MRESKPFNIRIPPDKESSRNKAQCVTDKIQVFTDGSIIKGKVGAAAILMQPRQDYRILHYCLESAKEQTIYDAKLIGLSLGLHLIKTKKAARCSITLGADR